MEIRVDLRRIDAREGIRFEGAVEEAVGSQD
jgi:hypothetical protein